jgi:hypothetical protein
MNTDIAEIIRQAEETAAIGTAVLKKFPDAKVSKHAVDPWTSVSITPSTADGVKFLTRYAVTSYGAQTPLDTTVGIRLFKNVTITLESQTQITIKVYNPTIFFLSGNELTNYLNTLFTSKKSIKDLFSAITAKTIGESV